MKFHFSFVVLLFTLLACSHAPTEGGRRSIASLDISSTFVPIDAGSFTMGSDENEYGRMMLETRHHVSITHDFEMQATPVTQIQFKRVMSMNPSFTHHKSECPENYEEKTFCCTTNPVESVSWYQVQNFIAAMNQKHDGYVYRLPTSAEWEYAARAGSSSTFFFGDDVDELGKYSWYFENSRQRTHPVASKRPNAWGLYDMAGNVRNWVADLPPEYTADAQIDPVGALKSDNHEIRGCSWSNFSTECRSGARFSDTSDTASSATGFRLVRTKAP